MKITYVKANLFTNKSELKAIASITLNNCFVIRNIKVIEKPKGILIAMPSIRDYRGRYVDIVHPINKETRQMLEENVKKAFQEMIDKEKSKIEIETNNEEQNMEENFEVTNVKINLSMNSKTRLRAKVSITLNNCWVVHGIKVISGEKGIFIAMPSVQNVPGNYIDISHPINKETRQIIESSIIESFQKMIDNKSQTNETKDEQDEQKIN